MIFYRILDNKLYHVYETNTMGFDSTDASFIPDDYLEQQTFVIMRTAHGIGDWGIISALPRLLKEKYPECKVFIPSEKMLENIFQISHKNAYYIFKNNPYIDGFMDEIEGDIQTNHDMVFSDGAGCPPIKQQGWPGSHTYKFLCLIC